MIAKKEDIERFEDTEVAMPTERSFLHVRDLGCLAVRGWGVSFILPGNEAVCPVFTADYLRKPDSFWADLLRNVLSTYDATEVTWVPVKPTAHA